MKKMTHLLKNRCVTILMITLVLALVTACGQPRQYVAYNTFIADMSYTSVVPIGITIEQVELSINLSLNEQGWVIDQQKVGRYSATKKLDNQIATVVINYDLDTVVISYVDSTNLSYNSDNGAIHQNYHKWVNKLNKSIYNKMRRK